MALGQLVNGQWTSEWTERNETGEFKRMSTQFRQWIKADGSTDFIPEPDRYHLYISLGCPWAHRTAILWKLKGLENIISISIVDPVISEQGWRFSNYAGSIQDSLYHADYLWQIYVKSKPDYTGRVTVPVLWDKKTQQIVNNESRQIIQMFNTEFDHLGAKKQDFYPMHLRSEIDRVINAIYNSINNGVYRSGFASSQTVYENAVTELFAALTDWDQVLAHQHYLVGDILTLADLCLFPTLFQFDLAYYGLFKCNLKHLWDFPHLWRYMRQIYAIPEIKEVCSADHVKRLYYMGIPELNPNQIIPLGSVNF